MTNLNVVQDLMLTLADQIENNNLSADVILSRIEDISEVLGRITALHDVDIDEKIVDTLRVIERRVRLEEVNVQVLSGTGAGRPPLDIPVDVLQTYVMSGLSSQENGWSVWSVASYYSEENGRSWSKVSGSSSS